MRRLLFNFAAAASLVLLFIVCVEWVRGYWVSDGASVTRIVGTRERPRMQGIAIRTCPGAFWFAASSFWSDEPAMDKLRVRWRERLDAGWRVGYGTSSKDGLKGT